MVPEFGVPRVIREEEFRASLERWVPRRPVFRRRGDDGGVQGKKDCKRGLRGTCHGRMVMVFQLYPYFPCFR